MGLARMGEFVDRNGNWLHNENLFPPPHTYDAWQTVSDEAGISVVTETGSVVLSDAKASTARRYAKPLSDVGIAVDWLNADELRHRYPQFRSTGEIVAFFHERSGIADPQRGNACHIALARCYGATILDENPALGIAPASDKVRVETEQGTFACKHLVVTAGA